MSEAEVGGDEVVEAELDGPAGVEPEGLVEEDVEAGAAEGVGEGEIQDREDQAEGQARDEAEGLAEDDAQSQAEEMAWLAGVIGVTAERLAELPGEEVAALAKAARRAEEEARGEAAAEAEHQVRVAAFVEGYAKRTGRATEAVGKMLEAYEGMMRAYASVEDAEAYRRIEAMVWGEVERMNPASGAGGGTSAGEAREGQSAERRMKDPGRIRKAGAHGGPAGYAGKRRVSLEGRI